MYHIISLEEYMMGRDKANPPTDAMIANAQDLLKKVNYLMVKYGDICELASGYRPVALNLKVGGASGSKHTTCNAIDLKDNKEQKFGNWCLNNLKELEDLGLYMEDLKSTPTWVHLQRLPPVSGNRVFLPYRKF